MRRSVWFQAALFSICLLLLLSSCGPQIEEPADTAMGRYVEEVLPLPQEIVSLNYLGLTPEGDFFVLGHDGQRDGLRIWRSGDGGASWETDVPQWLDLLDEYQVSCFILDQQGNPWFTYEPDDTSLEDDDPLQVHPLVYLNGREVEEKSYPLQSDSGNQPQNLQIRNGLAAVGYGGLALYDLNNGHRLLDILPDTYLQPGEYLLGAEVLAVADGAILRVFSTLDGRQTGELALEAEAYGAHKTDFFDMESSSTVLSHAGELDVIAYCNSSGIYRISMDGMIHERILDGAATSLIQPTTSIRQMFVQGEDYFVFVTDRDSVPWQLSGAALLRYRYDASVPAFPVVELKVCALHDSPTARQAAAVFRREHPKAQVSFEVMVDESGVITAEDALRRLSTELLAGQGPDVLILDGMPVDSYREKGVLLDMRTYLHDGLNGALLQNLENMYSSDNEVWAIPTRFTVPMLLAAPEMVAEIYTLNGLSAQIATLDSPQLGMAPGELFSLLYRLFSEAWYDEENGTVDEEALAASLEQMAAILSRYAGMDMDRLWNSSGDARVGSIGWIAGWTPFYLGELAAVEHLAGPYTAVTGHDAIYQPYPGVSQAKVYPRSVAGINAASANPELAAEFVLCMLSESVQTQKLGDGLPVSISALRAGENTGLSGAGRFGVSFYDDFMAGEEKGLTIPLEWPDKDFFSRMWAQIELLDVAAIPDATVKTLISREAWLYFDGTHTLEEAVQSLKEKLELYEKEQ